MSAAASEEIEIIEKAKQLLGEDYAPTDDEEYMSDRQQAYFQMLLLEWKRSIHDAAGQTLQLLADGKISRNGWSELRPLSEGGSGFEDIHNGKAVPKIILEI